MKVRGTLNRVHDALLRRPIAAVGLLAFYGVLAVSWYAFAGTIVRALLPDRSVASTALIAVVCVGIPLLLVTAPWAVAALIPRRRRYRPGLCPACGYDLRGSTGRCPECGRAFHWTEGKADYGEDPNL